MHQNGSPIPGAPAMRHQSVPEFQVAPAIRHKTARQFQGAPAMRHQSVHEFQVDPAIRHQTIHPFHQILAHDKIKRSDYVRISDLFICFYLRFFLWKTRKMIMEI